MKRIAAAVLGLVAAASAFAQEAGEAQVLALVTQARGRGCAGRPGVQAPLHWSDELARAARRMARGEAPGPAVKQEGYRGTRVFQATITGPRKAGEAADALAQHDCEALTDPEVTDFGFDRQGSSWVMVLAARVQLTQLGDARAVAEKVLALTNDARAHARRCGDRQFQPAPPLRMNVRLERAAALHAQDMAAHQYVEHAGRDGSTFAQRITRTGYRWQTVGENVAAGQRTPQDVVQDWLASPGHCANIMNDEFAEMGIAFSVNMQSRPVVYWAQEFGRTR